MPTSEQATKPASDKDDSNQLTKRRKQIDNMKGGIQKNSKRPKFEWSQSNEDLTLSMKVEGLKSDQLRNIDVRFADTDVTVKLPDGRSWVWKFSDEIFRENSRVKVKKQRITLHMKKKRIQHWQDLEALPQVADIKASEDGDAVEVFEPTESQEPDTATSTALDDAGSNPVTISDGTTNLLDDMKEEEQGIQEPYVKEEEPVIELQHIKHDYIEKEETFIVHIYVKDVSKDNLSVNFEESGFRVKFQTSNAQFLKLHPEATEETKFSWQIKLRGETVVEKCKYKLTGTLIELALVKQKLGRWGDLEALQRKETPVAKSDSWVSVNTVKTATSETVEKPDKNFAFDEMKHASEKETLQEKAVQPSQTKPMCKVQPLNKQVEVREQVVTPGFTGMDNLGNTCFMNGVLQCLINTRELRDFFLEGDFQRDLNTENVLGSGGKLAVSFAVLMRVMWSGKYYTYAPSKLKNLVAQKASQFTGFAQHDSQEFMAFLLDGLHEDLNRIKKKPYTETVEDMGRPDEVVANEAWAVHKKRNDSFIVDLFQGQYKSKLVCPVCGKVSITFDPFLYLSLPLPKRQRLLPVTFMWKDPYRRPVRYMLRLSKEATVEALKEALQKKTLVPPNNIRVFEAYKGRIHKIFKRGSSLSQIQANDVIIACEVLSEVVAGEAVYEIAIVQRTMMPSQFPTRCHSCKKLCPEGSKLKRCTKCYKVGYCDQVCQKTHWQLHRTQCKPTPEPVGTPFIISVPESRATFSKLCQVMESYSRYSVDVFQPPVKTELPTKLNSQLSSSNLSNSSQSSGSLNSLDSQSSFSSSCTITAEQEQNLDEPDAGCPDHDFKSPSLEDIQTSAVSTDTDQVSTGETGSNISSGGGLDISQEVGKDARSVESDLDSRLSLGKDFPPDSGYQSLTDVQSVSSLNSEAGKSATASCGARGGDFLSPVKPVLGIQSVDTERTTPMFFIKPVNPEGVGLPGPEGDRIEDKGDEPLDLTSKFFLSMDWKNNDKFPGYVLVQSKEMEVDNDSSMMTASLEENSNATLDQCMDLFTEPEVLSPEEAWYCPSCKEHREATKQLSTWKLPHTVIIQLKRFSFRNFIWRDKIDKMVEFPTRGLDMSAYYMGSRPANEPPPIYDLYGVVNHHGGILGGHYTSFVRCASKENSCRNEVDWRLCDDSRVSAISHEKNVVTRAAYLLFYRRREVFIPPPSCGLSADPSDEEDSELDASEKFSDAADNLGSEDEGQLIIDTAPRDMDLGIQDLTGSNVGTSTVIREGKTVGGVPVVMFDEEEEVDDNDKHIDLGYTDMDSVD